MTPFIAEIIGTMLLVTLGCGVVANVVLHQTKGNNSGWITITTGWALAVYIGVVVSSPYSGAHLNPAVSIGLAIAGKFAWSSVLPYIIAQFIGAMVGALIVWLTYKNHFDATQDSGLKRGVFCTDPAIRSPFYNLMGETIGTFILVFTILYFTDATIADTNTIVGLGSLGAIPVAFLVWSIGLSLGGTTGYAINPARDLGPRMIHAFLPFKNEKSSSDWGYAWIPVVGPVFGALLAAGLMLVLV